MKLEDLAKLAGVSKGAASLALNGKPGISEKKRQEVLRLAEEHNYRPLRKYRKKKEESNFITNNKIIRFIACSTPPLFPDTVHSLPYFSEFLTDLSTIAQSLPLSLLINSFSYDTMLEDLQLAEENQASDGIILLGTGLPDDMIKTIIQTHSNVVVVDTSIPYLGANFVSINNYQGAFKATEYLIQKGHRKIGYIYGDVRLHNFEERKRGFKHALQYHNIPVQNKFFYEFSATQIKKQAVADQLQHLPTAFFCENDAMAISLIKSLQDVDIQIPQDISVIGFDNIVESRVLTPELTTVEVNRKELIRQALKKIQRVISEPLRPATSHTLINTHIIERQSVIAPLMAKKNLEQNSFSAN